MLYLFVLCVNIVGLWIATNGCRRCATGVPFRPLQMVGGKGGRTTGEPNKRRLGRRSYDWEQETRRLNRELGTSGPRSKHLADPSGGLPASETLPASPENSSGGACVSQPSLAMPNDGLNVVTAISVVENIALSNRSRIEQLDANVKYLLWAVGNNAAASTSQFEGVMNNLQWFFHQQMCTDAMIVRSYNDGWAAGVAATLAGAATPTLTQTNTVAPEAASGGASTLAQTNTAAPEPAPTSPLAQTNTAAPAAGATPRTPVPLVNILRELEVCFVARDLFDDDKSVLASGQLLRTDGAVTAAPACEFCDGAVTAACEFCL